MLEKLFPANHSPEGLRKRFKTLQEADSGDPLANPVRRFAAELFQALEKGGMSLEDLGAIIAALELEAFEERAENFHRRNAPAASALGDNLKNIQGLDFEAFRSRIEQNRVGIVFTAHPTFALGEDRRDLLANYPGEQNRSGLSQWRKDAATCKNESAQQITLNYEHEQARKAITHAQDAIASLNREILLHARTQFADRWHFLIPDPISIASWVGYDLDGRTDIHWSESIRIRLEEKAIQLERYAQTAKSIAAMLADPRLEALHKKLEVAANRARAQTEAFAGDLHDPSVMVHAANLLTAVEEGRLTTLEPVIVDLSAIITEHREKDAALELSLLRAEMQACGLGVSRIHLRVNAAQVRSALRVDLGLDPDSDFSGRSALEVASQKASSAAKRSINFGSVFLEQMTARRQFMLCAQLLKHIDADTPIRFLIAECEAPATVMGAIYLARLYGVDQKLDISPLFETPQAMERGGRFLERLLDNPEYCAYVKARKRMSIQIGFSDSGRFIGQCTASLAIERLQVLFARALAKADLENVEALIFNTHGESMGRGAHPGIFRERLNHLATPWVKAKFRRENIPLNCEYSFQGGEGYVHFQTPALSHNTVSMLWEQSGEEAPADLTDQFYSDINFSWDFYRGLQSWQEALYDRDDYRHVLFAFPQQLLFKTGSRKTKRAREGSTVEIRSMRAIPHNAILQQLAIPVNVAGGVGMASGREADRFIDQVHASARMRELMEMVFKARSLTSISILRAYAGLYSPAYWSSLAGDARNTDKSEIYESVLQALLRADTGVAVDRLADYLARDLRDTDVVQEKLAARKDRPAGINRSLGVLHSIRQALVAYALSRTASAPDFSSRHDVDKQDLIDLTLNLKLTEVASLLKTIFPKETPANQVISGLEEKIEDGEPFGGAYPEIHEKIIDPLEKLEDMLELISRAIAHHYGAFG